jgi:hypothetical protein
LEILVMMHLMKWLRLVDLTSRASRCRAGRSARPRRPSFRPALESLEGRLTPTSYTWTGANFAKDLNWGDPENWSPSDHAPGASDSASFSGTTTPVCIIDSAVTVGGLTVTNTYTQAITVNAPLTITGDLILDFLPHTGTFGGNGAITINGSASSWSSGALSIGAGGLTNNGTLTIDTGTVGLDLTGTGTLTNNGTINEAGSSALSLALGTARLSNTGLYDFTSDCNISGGPLNSAATGTIAKTGGTGTTDLIPTVFNNLGGTMEVTSGTLAVGGAGTTALVDGATLETGSGARLNLTSGASVTYQGTITGSGSGTIQLNGGTLVVDSSGVTFDMPVNSLFQWSTGGVIDVSSGGTFTNAAGSTLNMNTDLVVTRLTGAGTLTNNGVINETGATFFELFNGATLSNKRTYNLKSDSGIGQSGGGTFANAGTLNKSAGTGTSTISCTLNNSGTLLVSSGTVHVSGPVTQISGGALNAGKWTVSVGGSRHGTLTIDTGFTTIGAHAAVTLNGANAAFTNLSSLASILSGGSLLLEGTCSLSTPGSLSNSGKLTVDAGSTLTVDGTFTQTSTATLTVQIKVSSTGTTVGKIVTAAGGGGASLGGKLALTVSGLPALSTPFTILDDLSATAITGMFSNLAEGGALTVGGHQYQIHYRSSTVTLTRIT